jgi:hypothetical protein
MRKSVSIIAIWSLLLLGTATVSAQGGGVPAADVTTTVEIQGYVVEFTAGSRSGMPLLVVDDEISGDEVSVAVGSAWYLQEAGFSVVAGDYVEVVAYGCSSCAAEFVAAWIENTTEGTAVELRDESGVPLWRGGYQGNPGGDDHGGNGGNGSAEGRGGAGEGDGYTRRNGVRRGNRVGGTWGLDMTTVTTVNGTVTAIRTEPKSGDPHLRLDVDGTELKIHLTAGAYNLLDAAGVLIELGTELTVTYALTKCSDPAMVAISIIDPATGLVVQLRDPETGFPIMGRRMGSPR